MNSGKGPGKGPIQEAAEASNFTVEHIAVCDFCNGHDAAWRYPCRTFTHRVGGVLVVVASDWRACVPCCRLIEADRWTELRQRSRTLYRAAHGPVTAAAETAIAGDLASLWLQFRANRTGPAERMGSAA